MHSQNKSFGMAKEAAQEVRGERLWQEVKWEGKQGLDHRSCLSSEVQAPSNSCASVS